MEAIVLRPFDLASESDYEAMARVQNTAAPEYPHTPDELREADEKREERIRFARFLAQDGDSGLVVGVGGYNQSPWQYHPRKFEVEFAVLPEYQGHGVGKQLYDRVMQELEPFEPVNLRTYVREDAARALRFYQDRGFREELRAYESRLDVAAFDHELFLTDYDRPREHGVVIKTLHELRETDPEADRKIWELEGTTAADVPSTEPFTPPPFDTYERQVLQSKNILPDAFIIAVEEATGQYVGSSNVWRRRADNDLDTGLTAVRREWRRKGIALAMKLRVVEWARANNIRFIRTDNEVNNRGMLSINERLGFAKVPPWVELALHLRPDEPASGES